MARILVVDDDSAIQATLAEAFAFDGYEVLVADNGQEAVKTARREARDLILMDVMTPQVDGATATRLLKENPATGPIPIIARSAGATLLLHAQDLPADAALGKPFDLTVLLANIAIHLEPDQSIGDASVVSPGPA
jgi:CheY-like chemotaxis protein